MLFLFNDTATTEIYTLSLHDALPISVVLIMETELWPNFLRECRRRDIPVALINGRISENSFRRYRLIDRKSTRLNSSHANTSYAVFCLKKIRNFSPCPTLSSVRPGMP